MIALTGALLATGFYAAPVEAGPFSKLKKAAKKMERVADDAAEVAATVEDVSNSVDAVSRGEIPAVSSAGATRQTRSNRYPGSAKRLAHAGRAGPSPAKYTAMTKCAGLPISNAMIGQYGKYTYSQGLQQEELTGMVNRETVAPVSDCVMPSLGTGDILYLEVPAGQLKAMKANWEMQCIDSATGKPANFSALPAAHNVRGKDIMLHTGNSAGYTPTATGSISDRSGAWDADLKRRGKSMMGFNMPDLHTDKGTDFYCQYYDKNSGRSAVAFSYRRSAGG